MRDVICTFELDKQPMSRLACTDLGGMVAFSGDGPGRNDPDSASVGQMGPTPAGTSKRGYLMDTNRRTTLTLDDFPMTDENEDRRFYRERL